MEKQIKISQKNVLRISQEIREKFYKPAINSKTSIFLCGAALNKLDKVRHKMQEIFSDRWSAYQYDLIFPEDIFEELLYNVQGQDLLSLENILAESIDIIMIIPESAGSLAELGAFANDVNLRGKIICLIDEKFKKDKSFINKGPVKLVKNAGNNGVIYIDSTNLAKSIRKIHSTIREIKKNNTAKVADNINLLQMDNFLLPTIYLLEPVSKNTLVDFVESVSKDDKNSDPITTTVLSILVKKKFVEINQNEYKLTMLGIQHYFGLKRISRIKYQKETIELDNLRLEILNLKLRNKKLKT